MTTASTIECLGSMCYKAVQGASSLMTIASGLPIQQGLQAVSAIQEARAQGKKLDKDLAQYYAAAQNMKRIISSLQKKQASEDLQLHICFGSVQTIDNALDLFISRILEYKSQGKFRTVFPQYYRQEIVIDLNMIQGAINQLLLEVNLRTLELLEIQQIKDNTARKRRMDKFIKVQCTVPDLDKEYKQKMEAAKTKKSDSESSRYEDEEGATDNSSSDSSDTSTSDSSDSSESSK